MKRYVYILAIFLIIVQFVNCLNNYDQVCCKTVRKCEGSMLLGDLN